jgi:hypothetical protein
MSRAGPRTQGIPWSAHPSARPDQVKSPFDSHHEALTIGRHGLEERFWRGFPLAVPQPFARVAQDADGHGAGRPVAPPIPWVWLGVEAPEVSSSCGG